MRVYDADWEANDRICVELVGMMAAAGFEDPGHTLAATASVSVYARDAERLARIIRLGLAAEAVER